MSAHEHPEAAGSEALRVAVITVSSTCTESEDACGDLVAAVWTESRHRVVSRRIVGDEVEAIRKAVQREVDDEVQIVVLTGGTGITPRDVTPEAVEPLFARSIPGFGELFRVLSWEEVGPAAMLSRATAGMINRTAVFALPGSRKACALAMHSLIIPQARRIVDLANKHQEARGRGQGWKNALAAVGVRVLRDRREPMPDALLSLAQARECLESAGERAVVELGEWRYSLWGWPDLIRPDSRVLAVSPGGTVAEVVALHRYPAEVGTCVKGDGGWVTSRDRPVAEIAVSLTGAVPAGGGALFAVADGAIYLERDGRIHRWDGHRDEPLGSPREALTQLILEWSAR